MLQYETYPLSHTISVQEIVSADYLTVPVWDDLNHVHRDAWELCCCLQGSLDVQLDGIDFSLRSNEVLLIPPGTDHLVGMRQSGSKAFVVSFVCTGDHHLHALRNTVISVNGHLLHSLENIREELEACFLPEEEHLHFMHFHPSSASPFGAEQMISTYLEQFIIRLFRSVTMDHGRVVSTGGFHEAMQQYLVQQVLDYIHMHLSEPLTVEMIASHFHYSRARLTTICKQSTGLGLSELIARERIAIAKQMLLEKKRTIAQISQNLGFSSPHYFSWKFKQMVGCAPSYYTEKTRSV